ncbi:RHS repeat-associated core domain-containing protein [Ureibacillus acetophenoni]
MNDFDTDGQITSQTILAKNQVQYRYGYYGNGYVKSYFDGNKTHTYTYDFANRLDTWNNGVSIVDYDYDNAGNLKNPTGQSLTFNAANEVESFEYDLEGNLLNDTRLSYQWDGLGQLTLTTDVNDGKTVSYTYHPDGLRKTKTVGSTTYHYRYDGSNLIRVTDNENKTVWAFTWNNGKLGSITNATGEEFEAITNYRGDVVQILDSTGVTIANYEYDPWGNLLSEEPTDSRIQGQPIRYAGYVYDSETKLYYLQARYYDPSSARFISRDPDVGNEDDPTSMNGYAYAGDNPIMMTDPDGKWFWMVVNAGMAIYNGYQAYKEGKNAKQIAWAVASSYIGIGHVKRVYRVAKVVQSNSVLKWSQDRIKHVNLHGKNDLQKRLHGVFYGNPTSVSNSAWAKRGNIKPIKQGNRDVYHIPHSNAGFQGGYAGQGQNLNYVTIVVDRKSGSIVTAFPSNGR